MSLLIGLRPRPHRRTRSPTRPPIHREALHRPRPRRKNPPNPQRQHAASLVTREAISPASSAPPTTNLVRPLRLRWTIKERANLQGKFVADERLLDEGEAALRDSVPKNRVSREPGSE